MNEQDSTNKIMQSIETGHVHMRPKSFFVAKMLLWGLGLGIAALSAIFVLSFVLFKLKLQGAWVLPGLGIGGVRDLLLSLPFFIMLYVVLFSGIFWWFTKAYSFAYRSPVVYSMLIVIGIVIAGGVLVAKTPLHRWAFERFGRTPGPVALHWMYVDSDRGPLHNGILGEVVEIKPNQVDIITIFRKRCKVIFSDSTFFPRKEDVLTGDFIIARGGIKGGDLYADGIKEIRSDDHLLRRLPEIDRQNTKLAFGCGQ